MHDSVYMYISTTIPYHAFFKVLRKFQNLSNLICCQSEDYYFIICNKIETYKFILMAL